MDEKKKELIGDILRILEVNLETLDYDTLKQVAKNTIDIFLAGYINCDKNLPSGFN